MSGLQTQRLLRRYLAPVLFVAALLAVIVLRDRPEQTGQQPWSFTGSALGTNVTVKLAGAKLDSAARSLVRSTVAAEIRLVDSTMSSWRQDSELQQLNRAGSEEISVSPPLLAVLDEARRVAEQSGGAFDITVAPLVAAWGFGPSPQAEPPAADRIEELLGHVGWQRLVLDKDAGTVRKADPGVVLDLAGIAKGYAVDRVVEALERLGYADVMVEIGGEVRAAGHGPRGRPWRIGIELPDAAGRTVYTAVQLVDQALATSGDYRSYYEVDGRRISHTIDPRSGRPISHRLASVSVVAGTCMRADAWATALDVLGPVEGSARADAAGLAALFLVREGAGFIEHSVGGFAELRRAASPSEER